MSETLLYGTRAMKSEPENMSLAQVAVRLKQGQSVVVQLEPGDATHYCLLLTPCWSDHVAPFLGRFGIRPSTAHDYLIVSYLHDTHGQSFYAFRTVEEWDLQAITNDWTRKFFVWWLSLLWEYLDESCFREFGYERPK